MDFIQFSKVSIQLREKIQGEKKINTDFAESLSNKCKNLLLKINS